ncbi:MAG: helix-turn-helix transcriptional regulator, partial [Caldilinea sp.]|nr:helix-turn-helix transcriptional regulator [Caldilinea sp.]
MRVEYWEMSNHIPGCTITEMGAIRSMVQPETTASFGYWVRRRRLTLDLTQADLANRVGCATVTISKIERDERRPSRQMAELLAEYLSIPADERERFLAVALGNQAVDRLPIADRPLAFRQAGPDDLPLSSLPTPSTPFVGRDKE